MILRSYQCNVTQVEHHVVTRYDSADGGFFRRHRANTSKDTAHLRFAIAINLNAENYEGGDLWFPEFGDQTYRASTGGAVVFACSLLHEDLPVSRGVRYAYLPFLSDGEHGKMHHNIKRSSIEMFPLADPNGSHRRT
jgi:predicted 2-oxoglutarate/Fe(II)-dependent dioxygenase YbiX